MVETGWKISTLEGVCFSGGAESTILDSAQRANVNFEYSCKNGQCGACQATLLKGSVIKLNPHAALTSVDALNNKILTCCCAPVSDILIDSTDLTALKEIEIKTLPVRISKIEKKTADIVEVVLRLPPSAKLKFLEGQHIDVVGQQGVRRSYSVANSASEKTLTLYIKKIENGVLSRYWFCDAKENDLLRIEGPKGSFFFREPKKNVVLLATGTGVAPIKSILDQLSDIPESINYKLSLYWGNRTPSDFFWEPKYPQMDFTYVPVLSRVAPGWQGKIGYVQDAVLSTAPNLQQTQVYACGSMEMINSAKKLFEDNHLDKNSFYSDAFVSS